jgi:hypothetical protein
MGKFASFPVSSIKYSNEVSEFYLREAPKDTDKDKEVDDLLVLDIAQNGLEYPPKVRLVDGVPVVWDGHRRIAAIRKIVADGLGFADGMVECEVTELSEMQALARSFATNHHSKKTIRSAEVRALKKLMYGMNLNTKQLASHVGVTEAYLIRMLKLDSMPEATKAIVDSGKINLGNAMALNTLPDEYLADEEWLQKAMSMTIDEFAEAVRNELMEIRKVVRAANAGVSVEFTPTMSMRGRDEVILGLQQTEGKIAEGDNSDYTRGQLDTYKFIMSLDEVTVAKAKSEWDAAKKAREDKEAARKAERELKKTEAAKKLLAEQGIIV